MSPRPGAGDCAAERKEADLAEYGAAMKGTLFFAAAALVLCSSSTALRAAERTYYVNLVIGGGTVTGSITTDGTIGQILSNNVLDWNLLLNAGISTNIVGLASPATIHLLGPRSGTNSRLEVTGYDLTATASDLVFNFSGDSYFAFFFLSSDGGSFVLSACEWCFGVVGEYFSLPGYTFRVGISGTRVIATATAPPRSQNVTFHLIEDVALGASPFPLRATASSGLAVGFTSTTPSVCTLSGDMVTVIAPGTCSVAASQAGNAVYAAASVLTQSFAVSSAGAPPAESVLYSNLGIGANVYRAGAPYWLVNSAAGGWSGCCFRSGLLEHAFAFTPNLTAYFTGLRIAVGTATGSGSVTVQLVSDAYTPDRILQSWTISGMPGTETCCVLQKLSGNGAIPLIAGTTYWVAVLPGAGTWASWNLNSTGATGPHAINAPSGSGWGRVSMPNESNGAVMPGLAVMGTAFSNGPQTIEFLPLSDITFSRSLPYYSTVTISATASSGLAVSFASTSPACDVWANTVTILSGGTCSITASQPGDVNFAAATPVTRSFTINPATQVITFGPLSDVTLGVAPFAISATASSGLAVSFASTTTSVCTVSGTTATIRATGICSITAAQAGNVSYTAAAPIIQSFAVLGPPAFSPTGTILYNNLGSGANLYTTDTFVGINSATGGYSEAGLMQPAMSFTPGITAGFAELDIAVGLVKGTGSLTVDLMTDSGGQPGGVLQSWTLNTLPGGLSCCIVQRLPGNGSILLVAGTNYWVAVRPGDSTYAWWGLSPTGASGPAARNAGAGWTVYWRNYGVGAFAVQGATPAAGTPLAPSIAPGGVVPACGAATTVQAGEWVSIYGSNLADSAVTWTGNFPTSLGGTSVTINGRPAFLSFVSPGQINLQAPDDQSTGSVPVVVTTGRGTAAATVMLSPFAPSLLLLDDKHVAGIIPRPDGSGAYGQGSYDIIGPTGNSLGYPTVAAKAGDSVVLFGVGFGRTNPPVPAGSVFSGAAVTTNPVTLLINNVSVTPSFAGLSGAGLYQLNLIIPAGLGAGDVSLVAIVGQEQTTTGVVRTLTPVKISLQ